MIRARNDLSRTRRPRLLLAARWLLYVLAAAMGTLAAALPLAAAARVEVLRAACPRRDFFVEYRRVWLAYLGFHTASP